ncbi:TRAP transporter substrate-binding protein [Devosia sp.]|uniref:TRAP transporter substrate-binding protein n=1 Tax=Devosia sp. TaxID=1871048 RepID=UPI00273454A9|nr:TRAP transporter substrate-binding protein [Devosia sp.]MDP2780604.1 TRAP transporter substrate-binding protein [Devosia sp.]
MLQRTFASLAIGLALGAASITPSLAESLRVSSYLPPNHTFQKMLEQWSEELDQATNGEVNLEIFPAGQLGPAPRQFELVQQGAVDIAIVLHGATPGRFPMSELAGLPLSYPSAGQTSAITSRRLTELAPEYLAEEHAGTKILWMGVTPALKIHTKLLDPSDIASLSGSRMRYAGTVWQQIFEALGASPLPVQPGETADALSKGIIDGASFPFEATKSFDLAPVIDYSMEPGLASATFAVVLNQQVYDNFSPELQALIDQTTGPDRAQAFGEMWDAGEAEGRQYMLDGGVDIVTLSDAQFAQVEEKVSPIVTSAVAAVDASGKPGKAFIEAYTK